MKKSTLLLASTILLLTVLLTGCAGTQENTAQNTTPAGQPAAKSASATGTPTDSTVTVNASSSVYAVPDIVSMNFGIRTQASSAESAQQANTDKTNAVIERLKEMNVPEENIKTGGFDMYPRYGNNGAITGYEVNTSLQILDQPLEIAGDLITAAINAGANQVHGLSYSCSRYDNFYHEALAKAVASARQKAEALAEASALQITMEKEIVEGYQDVTYRYNTERYNMSAMKDAAAEEATMEILPGEAEVQARITVTFGVTPK